MTDSPTPTRRYAPLIILIAVFVTFGRLMVADFSYWDDQYTIFANPLFQAPLSELLHYYWTTPNQGLYVPITYTVWGLVAQVARLEQPNEFGSFLNSWFFHSLSVFAHAASSLLVLRLLRRLIGDGYPALLGTLIFALHPVQVETIAWVSGFKDMLCWLLGLLSLNLYLSAIQQSDGRSAWRHWQSSAAALLLCLAILSKPTAMVIPAAMLVIDLFLVRRRWSISAIDIVPLLAISAAGAVLARVAQVVSTLDAVPLWQRPFLIGDTLAFYLIKIVWPATLTFDYGRSPKVAIASPMFYFHWLLPAAILILVAVLLRRSPIWFVAFALFVIGIAPLSGIATFQMQFYSGVTDHYLYFSMLGPALLTAYAIKRWPNTVVRTVAMIIVIALSARSLVQSGQWKDSITLFTHGMAVRPDDAVVAPNNLAYTYRNLHPSRPDTAEPFIELAYSRAPHDYFVLTNYIGTKLALGKRSEALPAMEKVRDILRTKGKGSEEHGRMFADIADSLLAVGEIDLGLEWAEEAYAVRPDLPRVRMTMALARKMANDRRSTPTTSPALPPATTPAG